MSLENYTELKKTIIEWSHRRDANLLIDDFIKLAESEMFSNDEEILNISSFETTVTLLTTGKEIDLPVDYLSHRSLKIKSNKVTLRYETPSELMESPTVGTPTSYTIIGNKIRFNIEPSAEQELTFDYLAEVTPLTSENPTNYILTKHPQIYLFGALWSLKEWAGETEDSQIFYLKFIKSIRGANKRYRKGKYGVAPQMRIKGSTP